MRVLRTAFMRNLFAFMAGVALLNVGFLQSEIDFLGLKESKDLIQTLANNAFEEESESGSESSEEEVSKEAMALSLPDHGFVFKSISFSTRRINPFDQLYLTAGYKSIFSPPPEA
jgi:hypothetical protein